MHHSGTEGRISGKAVALVFPLKDVNHQVLPQTNLTACTQWAHSLTTQKLRSILLRSLLVLEL